MCLLGKLKEPGGSGSRRTRRSHGNGLGLGVRISRGDRRRREHLHGITLDSDDDRLWHQIYGNHQALVALQNQQGSFHAVQASAANAHALTDPQKWIEGAGDVVGQKPLKILDLLIGDSKARAAISNETYHARCA